MSTSKFMDVRAKNSVFPVAAVVGRSFLTPGDLGLRVRNVQRNFGPAVYIYCPRGNYNLLNSGKGGSREVLRPSFHTDSSNLSCKKRKAGKNTGNKNYFQTGPIPKSVKFQSLVPGKIVGSALTSAPTTEYVAFPSLIRYAKGFSLGGRYRGFPFLMGKHPGTPHLPSQSASTK